MSQGVKGEELPGPHWMTILLESSAAGSATRARDPDVVVTSNVVSVVSLRVVARAEPGMKAAAVIAKIAPAARVDRRMFSMVSVLPCCYSPGPVAVLGARHGSNGFLTSLGRLSAVLYLAECDPSPETRH